MQTWTLWIAQQRGHMIPNSQNISSDIVDATRFSSSQLVKETRKINKNEEIEMREKNLNDQHNTKQRHKRWTPKFETSKHTRTNDILLLFGVGLEIP